MTGPSAPARIGLIADTHGLLRPSVLESFSGVLRILHAGDVGGEHVLEELETIAPVTAVYGNGDDWDLRRRLPAVAEVEEAGRRIVVAHGHTLGPPTLEKLAAAFPGADVIVFGHTHRAVVERVGRTLLVNPGAAGPARFELRPSVAILTLEQGEERVDFVDL